MTKNTSFKDFRYIWEYANWSIVSLRVSVTVLKYRCYACIFDIDGKSDFSIESLKFETRTLANIFAFSLTVFAGISVSRQALEVFNFKMSLRIRFFVFLKRKKEVFGFYYRLFL